ncbi:MAG: thioredoxin-dependent thiol peroxidase [Nanoarchaeota archaeon]
MELKIGQKAPEFILLNQHEKSISLNDFKGKWLVFYFYPKDNTPGCTIEAIDFSKYISDFKKLNCEIIGCSRDPVKSHCSFIDKYNLKIQLLVDEDHKVMEKYDVWGTKKFLGKVFDGIKRSTFLIDPKGNLAEVWYDVRAEGHSEKVLEKLKTLV